jgi:hypothetical protein
MATPPQGITAGMGGNVPSVPQAPGAAPGAQTSADPNQKAQQILAQLLQAASRKQAANTAVPMAIPAQQDPNAARQIGMNTANPHAWGLQRLSAGIQTNIKNAVAKQKQDQLLKAEGDWQYLQSALNEKYAAEQSGNQQAVQGAEAKLQAILGDPKKLKNMAKALNQDWLNPEKTTVYGEALKRVMSQQKQQDQQNQQKQQAAQGLKSTVQKLIAKAFPKQPQLTPDEQSKMAKEIEAKAPTTQGTADVKTLLDIEKASKDLRENYQMITSPDGKVWAVNKTNPKDAFQVKDSGSGQGVEGQTKTSQTPKVLNIKGVPYGVQHGKDVVTPDSEKWTPEDAKLFDAAQGASLHAQQLRIDPVIADEIGAPPDPKEFKGGASSSDYEKALRTYGQKAEQVKNRMVSAQGTARAIAFNQYRPVQAMDDDGNVFWTTAKAAIEGGMAGASEGVKLKPREAQMADIQVASQKTRDAINALDEPFSPDQIAKLHLAVTTPDDSVANAELTTLATQGLTDKQQDFVVWVKQLNERAMSLRNVAGMGTGAQDLRNAIRDMIPGVRSGSKEMMNKQLDAFDNQVKILKSGVAHPGKPKPEASAPKVPKVGDVIDGYKFKGGNPADPNSWAKQ